MSGNNRPTADERHILAEADTQDDTEVVATSPHGAANYGYAYHHIRHDGESVYCGHGTVGDEFESVRIKEAQRRSKSPCQMCERILSQQ